ncbi:hypothetical protein ABPG75_005233 [Micractinium tetrahymenae]
MSPEEAEAPAEAAPAPVADVGDAGGGAEPPAAGPSSAQLELGELLPAGGCRDSEELHPVSLTDLFAADPECAAKAPEKKLAGGLARSMAFAGAGIDDELELKKLQVFVRIRPSVTSGAPAPKGAFAADLARENCVHATSRHSIAIAPPEGSQAYKSGDRGQTYSFTRVFDRDTPQEEYYESTAAPLVRDLLRNPAHNSAMLAYGITAAGKTYTIEGTREQPGVLPRALVAVFQGLQSHVEPVVARAAYYEVYNEQIYDLLDEQGVGPLGQRAPLRLKEDSLGRVFVAGLSEAEVASADEALALLRRGSRQRQRAETGLNYSSSRSHSIFTITLYQLGLDAQSSEEGSDGVGEEGGGRSGEEKLGRMSFVDLAGSERAQRTGNVGVRLKESVAINSSLMTLGRCLEALRWNQQHKNGGNLRVVPYRESKVTHLFRDALHGWGQVVLSVNVSPVARDYDETAHVLKYAALATQIGTIQQAEAPRRTIKAVSPAIRKVKRKAALPPEARGQGGGGGGGKAKKAKKEGAPAAGPAAAASQAVEHAATSDDAELAEAECSLDPEDGSGAAGLLQAAPVAEAVQEDAAGSVEPEQAVYHLEAGAADDAADEAQHDEEYACTPATPVDAEDEAVAALQAQVQQLIADLQKAEERCVLLEAEVREEVADEMAQLLRDMEESYRLRLEAEVEALEKKMASEAAGKRGRGRNAKAAAKPEQLAKASAEDLAAAHAEAAEAVAKAGRLQQQVEGLQQQLTEARAQAEQQAAGAAEQVSGLQAQLASAQQQVAGVAASLAAEQQRSACLEAELAASRQQAQAELGAAQQQVALLQGELAAAQQAAAQAQAGLAAAQQAAEELGAQVTAAQRQVAELGAELAAAQQQVADLSAKLATARAAADSEHRQASEQYEAQLQEAVTQLEANKSMELEMAEEQCERLRKENMALKARLQAALAAVAACGSPVAGPAALAMRMAQAAPEGNGRGAGGTPHDVALARARQAAAAEELAAGGGAAGSAAVGSAGPRSRSRFAEQAEAPAVLVSQSGEDQLAQAAAPSGRKGRAAAGTAADKENAAGKENATGAAAAVPPPAQPAEQQAASRAGGKRRKRLLPSAPMSADMRAALGDLEDGSLRQQMTAKQASAAKQAAAAVGTTAEEEGGKRRRRQTQFFRL